MMNEEGVLDEPENDGRAFVLSLCTSPSEFNELYYNTPVISLYGFQELQRQAELAMPKPK